MDPNVLEANDSNAYDLSDLKKSLPISSSDSVDKQRILAEYEEFMAGKKPISNLVKSYTAPQQVEEEIVDGTFFKIPNAIEKDKFLSVSRQISSLVMFTLAPLGLPKDFADYFTLEEFKQRYDSLFHDVIEVCSEKIYHLNQVNESTMATSAHKWLEESKDMDCRKQMDEMKDILSRLYQPSRFIEIPLDSSEEMISQFLVLLKNIIVQSINTEIPWAINATGVDHQTQEDSWEQCSALYPTVAYALGFQIPKRPYIGESSLRTKAKIEVICKSILNLREVTNIALEQEQMQALVDTFLNQDFFSDNFLPKEHVISLFTLDKNEKKYKNEKKVQDLVKAAKALHRTGNCEGSIKHLSEALLLVPIFNNASASILTERSNCYFKLDMLNEARRDAEIAVRVCPSSSEALSSLAQVNEREKNIKQALWNHIKSFTLNGSRNPTQAEKIEELSREMGRRIAKDIFEEKEKCHKLPSNWLIESYAKSFNNDIDRDYTRKTKNDETLLGDKFFHLQKCVSNWKNADYLESQKHCISFLEKVELNADDYKCCKNILSVAYNFHASFLYLCGDLSKSLVAIEKSISFDPKCVNSWLKKGGILCEMSNYDEALESFDAAVEIDSNDSDIYLHRGQMHLLSGNYYESVRDLRRSINYCDTLCVSYVTYGMALYKNGSMQQALEVFSDAVDKFPDAPEVRLFLGEVLLDQGNFRDAMFQFSVTYELSPSCPLGFLNAGRGFVATNDPVYAIKHFEEAMKVDDRCSQAHLDVAQVYFAQDRTTEAFYHFDKAIEYARFLPEVEDVCACRFVAETQLNVAKDLGVNLRHVMKLK